VRISAKVDYAVRAVVVLASEPADGITKADNIARCQQIPLKFLLNILSELRRARIVTSQRGTEGGYQLARPASGISVADIIRAVEGPLATVHEILPEQVSYPPPTQPLQEVWIAVRASLRAVLETVTVADLAAGHLPQSVRDLIASPEARQARP
jgi:Rrf2 family protein